MENKPSVSLPGAGQLLGESWRFFTAHWNTTFQLSVYFIYFGLLFFLSSLLFRVAHLPWQTVLPLAVAWLVFLLWIVNRLTIRILRLDADTTPQEPTKTAPWKFSPTLIWTDIFADQESLRAWRLILPLLWIDILVGLAVFGGTLLLIIPGIYLSIALSFSKTIAIDQGTLGAKALSASRDLVKGRWWSVLWRFLAGQIVIGLALAIIQNVLRSLLGIAFNYGRSGNGLDPVMFGSDLFLSNILYAAFMPLIIAYQVKVYRALTRTR